MNNATDNSLQGLQAAARRQQEREDLIEKDGYLRGWNAAMELVNVDAGINLARQYWRGVIHGTIGAVIIQIAIALFRAVTL